MVSPLSFVHLFGNNYLESFAAKPWQCSETQLNPKNILIPLDVHAFPQKAQNPPVCNPQSVDNEPHSSASHHVKLP